MILLKTSDNSLLLKTDCNPKKCGQIQSKESLKKVQTIEKSENEKLFHSTVDKQKEKQKQFKSSPPAIFSPRKILPNFLKLYFLLKAFHCSKITSSGIFFR